MIKKRLLEFFIVSRNDTQKIVTTADACCGAPDNKIVRKPLIYRVRLHFLALNKMDFKFSGEHFQTAGGALVVLRAVVGNHYSSV